LLLEIYGSSFGFTQRHGQIRLKERSLTSEPNKMREHAISDLALCVRGCAAAAADHCNPCNLMVPTDISPLRRFALVACSQQQS
jgi:hypothetical protein